MSFLSAFILPGLALAAIPIIIHLLSRQRVQVVEWAAMRFLHDVIAQRRRKIRLEDILLMLLRVLLIAVLVLAMAQPFLRNLSFIGADANQDVIIVLDVSASTTFAKDGQRVFDEQVRAVKTILDALRPGDTVDVLLAAQSPAWLSPRPMIISNESRQDLATRLAAIRPQPGGCDIYRSLDAAFKRLPDDRNPHRQIIIVTDGQAAPWSPGEGQQWQRIKEMAAGLKPVPVLQVLTVSPPHDGFANTAITEVRLDRAAVGRDRPVKALVRVKNNGTLSSGARTVKLLIDGEAAGSIPITAMESGAEATVELPIRFVRPGPGLLTAEIATDDPIQIDDRFDLAVNVLDRLPVLVVDGSPSGRAEQSGSFYVATALDPAQAAPGAEKTAGRKSDFVADVEIIGVADLSRTALDKYAAICLLDVPAISKEAAEELTRYVRRGGGLLFAPGDGTNAAAINEVLAKNSDGLLPAALQGRGEPPADAKDKSIAVQMQTGDNPVTANFGDPQRSDADSLRVYAYYKLAEPALASPSRRVLLRLAGGSPALISQEIGAGRVLEFAVPLDASWTNWPAHRAFPMLLNDAVTWLAEPQLPRRHLLAGQPIVATVPAAPAGPDGKTPVPNAMLQDPLGKEWPVRGEPQGDQVVYRAGIAGAAGVYRLKIDPVGEGVKTQPAFTLLFSTAPDVVETNLTWLTKQQQEQIGGQSGMMFAPDVSAIAATLAIDKPGSDISQWLLIAVLALLVCEVLVTRRLARARGGAVPAVAGAAA